VHKDFELLDRAKKTKELVQVFPAAILGNRELNDMDEASCAVTKA